MLFGWFAFGWYVGGAGGVGHRSPLALAMTAGFKRIRMAGKNTATIAAGAIEALNLPYSIQAHDSKSDFSWDLFKRDSKSNTAGIWLNIYDVSYGIRNVILFALWFYAKAVFLYALWFYTQCISAISLICNMILYLGCKLWNGEIFDILSQYLYLCSQG